MDTTLFIGGGTSCANASEELKVVARQPRLEWRGSREILFKSYKSIVCDLHLYPERAMVSLVLSQNGKWGVRALLITSRARVRALKALKITLPYLTLGHTTYLKAVVPVSSLVLWVVGRHFDGPISRSSRAHCT